MSREDNEDQLSPSERLKAGDHVSRWSQVTSSGKSWSHAYWLGGGVIAVGLVLLMSSHPPTRQAESTPHVMRRDYRAALHANLAHLAALENKASQHEAVGLGGQFPTFQQAPSKAYVARENAPTSMYTGHVLEHKDSHGARGVLEAMVMSHPEVTLAAGEFLHAILETAINSDLPGPVRAVVSTPAYAYTGERLLIPAGSRLIGQYQSARRQGQNRVMVRWNRLILPGGRIVELNSPGVDRLGQIGQGANRIDTHFMARFGESALLSLIGAGASMSGVKQQDQYNSQSQYRMALSQSFQQSASASLQDTVGIKPTLHIHQGVKITVFVAKDVSFYHVLQQKHNGSWMR